MELVKYSGFKKNYLKKS